MKLCVASKSLGIENKKTDKRTAQNSSSRMNIEVKIEYCSSDLLVLEIP